MKLASIIFGKEIKSFNMTVCSERMYRIEVINLSGEIVFLSLDSKNQINKELLKGKLPDEAYMLRIRRDNYFLFEKLLLNQDCQALNYLKSSSSIFIQD